MDLSRLESYERRKHELLGVIVPSSFLVTNSKIKIVCRKPEAFWCLNNSIILWLAVCRASLEAVVGLPSGKGLQATLANQGSRSRGLNCLVTKTQNCSQVRCMSAANAHDELYYKHVKSRRP